MFLLKRDDEICVGAKQCEIKQVRQKVDSYRIVAGQSFGEVEALLSFLLSSGKLRSSGIAAGC
jgi:hypothetical protein